MLLIALVLFLLKVSLCTAGDPCPPKAELAPCTCSYLSLQNCTALKPEELALVASTTVEPRRKRDITSSTPSCGSPEYDISFTVVNCQVAKTVTALDETVSSALNRKLVDKLIVANVPPEKEHALARLPSGWLKNVRVRQFQVQYSKMSGDFIWYGDPFEGQNRSLLWFSANKCGLSGSLTYDTLGTVNTKGLNTLHYIQGVNFSQNYLTSISSMAFRYPPANLSTVDLSRNSIQQLEGGTFVHIPFLKRVNLSHNLLGSVLRSIFASHAKNLEEIDLSWNSLTVLPADFFNSMQALQIVKLSNNFIYSLPGKPWAIIWRQLNHVDLTGNFLECNCDLLWLLPILAPPVNNSAATLTPAPLPGQTVRGDCSKTVLQPFLFSVKYDLVTLTRNKLNC